MTIVGHKLNETQIELFKKVVAKAKAENRNDFEEIFREIMQNSLSFYNAFFENFEMNVTNIQANL